MGDNQNIFSDKIKLAASLVSKEMNMISQVNTLKSGLKHGKLEIERLEEYPNFRWSWQNISELYDFLKYEYLNKLEKKDQDEVKKIMEKYDDLNEKCNYPDLIDMHNYILKMMSATGFHSVDTNFKNSVSLMDPTQKW